MAQVQIRSEKAGRTLVSDATGKTEIIRVKGFSAFFAMLTECKNNGDHFRTIVSSNTRTLIINRTTNKEKWIFSDDFFPMGLMHYVKKIKEDVLWHSEQIKVCEIKANPFEIDYYDFAASIHIMEGQKDTKEIYFSNSETDIYEADISMCYYITAFKLGFMSETMFNLCKDLPKNHRLKLLGAIATSKTIRDYEGKKIIFDQVIEDKLLREAWFKICTYVGQAMQTVKDALAANFLFYWVDGIYFTYPKNCPVKVENLIEDITKHLFFEWKIKKIHSLSINNKHGKVEMKMIDNAEDHPDDYRFFYPPKKKIIAYRMGSEYDFLNI